MATTTHEARNFPKLNGKNFSNWQPNMLVLLEQKGRLNKIILKTDVKPLPVFNLNLYMFLCLCVERYGQWRLVTIESVLCKTQHHSW